MKTVTLKNFTLNRQHCVLPFTMKFTSTRTQIALVTRYTSDTSIAVREGLETQIKN